MIKQKRKRKMLLESSMNSPFLLTFNIALLRFILYRKSIFEKHQKSL